MQTSNLLTEVLETMAEVNVEKLAGDIGTTVDKLLQQFSQAGITKQAGESVTEAEKATLLDSLKQAAWRHRFRWPSAYDIAT